MGNRIGALRAVTVAAVLALSTACGTPPAAPPGAAPAPAPAAVTPTITPYAKAPESTEKVDFEGQLLPFDRSVFSNPTKIDNQWYPLKPGAQFTYDGVTQEGAEAIPHKIVFTVTDLTKVLDGVRTVVLFVEDFKNSELAESELAFRAQDNSGNVWSLGEYPETYEGGRFVEAKPWIATVTGARAGIAIKKDPALDGLSYSQGWSPTVPWTDRARVSEVGVADCVPAGCYQNQIVVAEFSREEPDATQTKYYAPGVGNTRVSFTGQDLSKERLELVRHTQLGPPEMAAARLRALELESRAYQQSKDVYGRTGPSEQTPVAN